MSSVRILSERRRFTEFAVVEERRGREPLRSEVLRNNKTNSYYCRACNSADVCHHVHDARRFMARRHLAVLPTTGSPT